MDKAGSYGIQGAWGAYVKGIRGDYNNVVGLPVARLIYETKKTGNEPERMKDKMIKACIFDLDGTIADTLESMAYVANEIMEKFSRK